MKYPASRVCQGRFGALVLGIILLAHVHPTLAQSKPVSNGPSRPETWNSNAVPDGISASDWAGIRAAHQATLKRPRLATNGPAGPTALASDDIAQQAYVKASNTGFFDNFGFSVAISGDTVVVGANGEDSKATGVNGDQTDNSANGAGAAYVFVRNGTTWTQQAYLKASNTEAGDAFATSVAISGDTVVVGARLEDSDANGVNGDQSDNSAPSAGAAYVFVRNGTTWTQQAYLKASNSDSIDNFGIAVAASADTVVVAADLESSNATGVNGDQTDNSALQAGAAYAFVRNGVTWTQQAYLKASNTDGGDVFGNSIALSGDTVAVGAQLEASNATGINGDQSDNSAGQAGATYIFVRNGSAWSQQAYVKASNTEAGDDFGFSVGISGDTVVVGANLEGSSATGVNGDQNNNNAGGSGAAYVFARSGTTWSQQAYLKASNTDADDLFGESVASSADTVVVGAWLEQSNATGIDGDQADDSASQAGAVYVFVRNGAAWSQQTYLKASNTDIGDKFGNAVAISGDTAVIAAYLEASNATGINGDETYNLEQGAGAAYVFTAQGSATSIPLLNISTRADVGVGDNVLIGGFIVIGNDPKKVLLRAIGPSLTDKGVPDALADPIIELHNPDMSVVTNDNWRDTQEQEIMDTTIPPTDDLEAAILATLDPGFYTAVVRGKNDTTGVGLVKFTTWMRRLIPNWPTSAPAVSSTQATTS
ncbi:MAG: FG-GAP repeat protein [Chthoniobacterales bacterium]